MKIMAKLIDCELCGKEIKKGFLGLIGDAKTLWLGDEFVACCPECLKKYKDFAKVIRIY